MKETKTEKQFKMFLKISKIISSVLIGLFLINIIISEGENFNELNSLINTSVFIVVIFFSIFFGIGFYFISLFAKEEN